MTNTLLTLHDPEAAARYYAEGLWRKDTLYTLLSDHAARRPDDFALRDGARRLTWTALKAMVDAVAADLDAAGLKRGERVAVWLPNRVEAVARSEEHTSELQSRVDLVCRLLLEK